MSEPDSKERFVLNTESLFGLVEDLIQNAYNNGYKTIEPSMIRFVNTLFRTMDSDYIIQRFISRSRKHWEKIKNRDESFFIENASSVFEGLSLENINAFKNLFELTKEDEQEPYVVDEDREAIWDHFQSLVKISLSYLKENPNANKWGIHVEKELEIWKHVF